MTVRYGERDDRIARDRAEVERRELAGDRAP